MGTQDEINTTSDTQITLNEKIPVITESDEPGSNKSELHIDDEAGAIAAQALASGPADTELSKKVLRKID
ncbi:hypothetical protein ONS96_008466 [Cadophora gregata f. sp. sojae]|nr:hypothetical protein ONS96_008466 [Cadophora gregata f. sp. sojae]